MQKKGLRKQTNKNRWSKVIFFCSLQISWCFSAKNNIKEEKSLLI